MGLELQRPVVAFIASMLVLVPECATAVDEEPASAGVFTSAAPMVVARAGHTVTLLADGLVLIVGAPGELRSAEMWDPNTLAFEPAGSTGEGRGHHTSTLLPDGRVMIAGGEKWIKRTADIGYIDSVEAWDSSTGTSARIGTLDQARALHTATLLPDGRILVLGGLGSGLESLGSAEIWDPARQSWKERSALRGWTPCCGPLPATEVPSVGRLPVSTVSAEQGR